MNIAKKLMLGASLLTVVAVTISAGFTGWLALKQSQDTVEHSVRQQFQAVAAGRQSSLQQRMQSDGDLLLSLANSRMTQEAVYGFVRPYVSYRYEVMTPSLDELRQNMMQWYQQQYQPLYRQRTQNEQAPLEAWLPAMKLETLLLQQYYIKDNPNRADALSLMDDRSDASIYGQQHRRYQASYREIMQRYGFDDLMLVDANSLDVIYSVQKSPVFATSLRDGPFKTSELARLAQRLQQNPTGVMLSRFAGFEAFFNEQSLFVGVPVFHPVHSPKKAVGFLIAQVPANIYTDIMTGQQQWQAIGLGDTGESYLVNQDARLVTELRPMLQQPEAFIQLLQQQRSTGIDRIARLQRTAGLLDVSDMPSVTAALAGAAGLDVSTDYTGQQQLISWQPIDIDGARYALITQQSLEESFGAIAQLTRNIWLSVLLAVLVLGLVSAIIASFWARYLAGPLAALSQRILAIAEQRDLQHRFDHLANDEVGDICRALNQLFDNFSLLINQLKISAEQTASAATENVQISLESKAQASGQRQELQELQGLSQQMMDALLHMTERMHQAAEQARQSDEQAELGAQSVSTMATLMAELAAQVATSSGNMDELQQATDAIVSVLDTIKGVAEQTNLLALNAAIEAARAGEHGRGFAVVADEVRRLSVSTQEATAEIQQMIDRLRATVSEAGSTLMKEQRSAEACVDSSQQAEAALVQIRQGVSQIRQATADVADDAMMQSKRSEQMGQQLNTISNVAEQTEQAMVQLAETAESQEQAAITMQQAAAVFK